MKHGLWFIFAVVLFSFLVPQHIYGQGDTPDVTLDVTINQQLNEAQVISLSTLGIDRRGRGQQLARMILRNNENRSVDELYFNFSVESSQRGEIATGYQRNSFPFSLKPNQVVTTTNNMIQDGIDQIEQDIFIDAELTNAGEELYNDLEGTTRLPNDIFTLTVRITRNRNLQSGGEVVAQSSATIGNTPSVQINDIYLQTPGGEVGGEEIINTAYPEFAWDAASNTTYRLVVVEDNGSGSAQDLIESAKSSQPALDNGSSGQGSLLEFENADVLIKQSSFQYPSSGVQSLEPGNTYYWQVIAMVQGANQTQEVNSEIWSFTLRSGTGPGSSVQRQEIQAMLEELLGTEQYNELQQQGYDLQSITINGQNLEGPAAASRLSNFMEKVRSEEITITVEQ